MLQSKPSLFRILYAIFKYILSPVSLNASDAACKIGIEQSHSTRLIETATKVLETYQLKKGVKQNSLKEIT